MGVSTVTAARILKGQLHHHTGEETRLEMDKFPFVALSKVSPSSPPSLSLLSLKLAHGVGSGREGQEVAEADCLGPQSTVKGAAEIRDLYSDMECREEVCKLSRSLPQTAGVCPSNQGSNKNTALARPPPPAQCSAPPHADP